MTYGIGYNWFDFLGSGGNYARDKGYPLDKSVVPDLDDSTGWACVFHALDELKPGFIRFGLPPDHHCDANGRFTWRDPSGQTTVHLERLRRLDQWATRNGCVVQLDTFVIPRAHEMPIPPGTDPVAHWHPVNMAAANNEHYARDFVAPLLKWVVEAKLESVTLFNPVNEPIDYGVYQTPPDGPDVFVHYVDMYRHMRQALDDAGVSRQRVGLLGLDSLPLLTTMFEMLARDADLNPYVDGYSIHYYNLRFDYQIGQEGSQTTPMIDVIDRIQRQLVSYFNRRGKPVLITEIGTVHYGWRPGNPHQCASMEAVLTIAEGMVRGINVGSECQAVWCLFNPNDIDGRWSVMQVRDRTLIRCGHPYAVYGMMSRTVRPGSIVRPLVAQPKLMLQHVHATLLNRPDGSHAIVLINDDSTQNANVTIDLGNELAGSSWSIETCDRVRLNEPVDPLKADDSGRLTITAPAFSISSLVHS
jgi:hypothetical protein